MSTTGFQAYIYIKEMVHTVCCVSRFRLLFLKRNDKNKVFPFSKATLSRRFVVWHLKINRYSGGYTELCCPETNLPRFVPFLETAQRPPAGSSVQQLYLGSSLFPTLHKHLFSLCSPKCFSPHQEVTQQSNCTSGRRQSLQAHSFNKTSIAGISCIAAHECKILLIKLQGCKVDVQLKTTEYI